MLLKIIHQTDLTYSDLISESVMELRVQPRQEADQHRLSFSLAVGPPSSVNNYFDWLGNTVHTFAVNPFHNQIRIVATSVVETDRQKLEPERFSDVWPIRGLEDDHQLYDYTRFGGPIVDSPQLRELIKLIGPVKGMSLGELALRVLHVIDEKFQYFKGVTNSSSPITELLEHGKGVCQDFAHLMIGAARAMNIPARYVSGLVHPDAKRFRGYTQTHAWAELYFPTIGWIGFDPTNHCIVGGNFVKVAIGRDYDDVPPNKGVYRGAAIETIDVQVKSAELKAIPPEAAAERVLPLGVDVFPGGKTAHRELVTLQQEHQQQQQ